MAAPLRGLVVRLGHAWRMRIVAAGLVEILTRSFLDINSPLVHILFAASIKLFFVFRGLA